MALDLSARALPYSLDAERAVLGAILIRPDLWHEVSPLLQAGEFFRDAHRRIYEAMQRVANSGGAEIDFLVLNEELRASGELDEVGGPAYISALVDGIPRSTNAVQYAEIVREKARLRSAIFAAGKVMEQAYDGEMSSGEILEAGARSLLELSTVRAQGAPVSVGKAVLDYMFSLDQPAAAGVTLCGFRELDDLLAGGFRAGDLAIVAARPSVGKSSFGLQVALAAAQHGLPSAFFSLEMSTEALAARVISWGARIDGHRLRTRMLDEDHYGRISQACAVLSDVPLQIQDCAPGLTHVVAWCHQLKQREEGLWLAVVDYMQLMTRQQGRSLHEEVAALSGGLKRLAKEERMAIVALSQLSRAPEGRADKRPHMSDLRDSGALEQDADIGILLFREEMYTPTDENRGLAEVILAKQRNGPTGVVKLAFLESLARFENLAEDAPAEGKS